LIPCPTINGPLPGDGQQSGWGRLGPVAKPPNRFYVDFTKHQPSGGMSSFEKPSDRHDH
jgi:hypothetical protein